MLSGFDFHLEILRKKKVSVEGGVATKCWVNLTLNYNFELTAIRTLIIVVCGHDLSVLEVSGIIAIAI